jgi:hypothetical protein
MARVGATVIAAGFLGLVGIAAAVKTADDPPTPETVTVTTEMTVTTARMVTATVQASYQGRSARDWQHRYRHRTRQLQQARAHLHRRWQPTVSYALRLAAAVTGVPLGELQAVARCESTFNPFASNGRYLGLFQLGWSPFGFSPFDPVANALSAAMTVRHDGGWRQWECKP